MDVLRIVGTDDAWSRWNTQQQREVTVRHVPEGDRGRYAANTSLRAFYADCLSGRWEPLGRKQVRSRGTLAKERQALTRWERYTRPGDWPAGIDWPGPSLETISRLGGEWFEGIWQAMRRDLELPTVNSTRGHLRVILRHAVTVKALPTFALGRPLGAAPPRTKIYTPAQVTALLAALRDDPDLQSAVWLALHVGARPIDLFLLKWSDFVRDARGRLLLDFESRKTGKLQGIPIAPAVWEVLDRLPRSAPYLFPALGNAEASEPEKSWQARSRNSRLKWHLQRAGITGIDKPWQVARATCNERYESHRPGVGGFILGHSLQGVNARSYRQPTEAVHEAVRTLPPYEQVDRQLRLF